MWNGTNGFIHSNHNGGGVEKVNIKFDFNEEHIVVIDSVRHENCRYRKRTGWIIYQTDF